MNIARSQTETSVNGADGPISSNIIPPARVNKAIPKFANRLYTPSMVPLIALGRLRMKYACIAMNYTEEASITATIMSVEVIDLGSYIVLNYRIKTPLIRKESGTNIEAGKKSAILPMNGTEMAVAMTAYTITFL